MISYMCLIFSFTVTKNQLGIQVKYFPHRFCSGYYNSEFLLILSITFIAQCTFITYTLPRYSDILPCLILIQNLLDSSTNDHVHLVHLVFLCCYTFISTCLMAVQLADLLEHWLYTAISQV